MKDHKQKLEELIEQIEVIEGKFEKFEPLFDLLVINGALEDLEKRVNLLELKIKSLYEKRL